MSEILPKGKLSTDLLKKIIFHKLGVENNNVIIGPKVGEDATVIRLQSKYIIVTTDPITGAVEDIGRLAINVNANDVGAFGVKPKFFLATVLLPVGSTTDDLKKIMAQLDEHAKKLGISIVGGHTEITDVVKQPVIIGIMIGETEKDGFVTSSGAKIGDKIILTKYAGIEGTAILAEDCKEFLKKFLTEEELNSARELKFHTSVVIDGTVALRSGAVTAMHDPTEGGVIGALYEIAEASNVGFIAYEEKIPVLEITQKICSKMNIDPLKLISSGALLITANRDKYKKTLSYLKDANIPATVIGEITDSNRKILVRKDGTHEKITEVPIDELWKALRICRGKENEE